MSKNTASVPLPNLARPQTETSLFSYLTNKYVLGAIAVIIIAVAAYFFFMKKKKKQVTIVDPVQEETKKESVNEKKEDQKTPETNPKL